MLDHAWIMQHIPHQGDMCLLDSVRSWDEEQIECIATSHRLVDNPLRYEGRLGAANGIEYAAQAMAVHGALLAQKDTSNTLEQKSRGGYLTSVRTVELFVARLDQITEDLIVYAQRLMGDEQNILYSFRVSSASQTLLEGRASVMLNANSS